MTRVFTMHSMALLAALVAALTLGIAPVLAQAQPRVVILHEVPDDGYTFVGNPTSYGWILLGDDGSTNVHKNAKIRVSQNGVILYETKGGAAGMDTAHDYDALNPFVVAFPRQGPYEIYSEVAAAGGLKVNSTFTGYVHAAEDLVKASIVGSALPATATAGMPAKFEFQIADEAGTLLPHTDALFEVRRASDNWLLFRVHTHSHNAPMAAQYAFPEAGEYLVRIVGYQAFPEKTGVAFQPVTKLHKVTVAAGTPMFDAAPTDAEAPSDGSDDKEGDYVLLVTYDPAPSSPSAPPNVGPFGNVRLNVLVYEPATKTIVPHVNFKATLRNAVMQTRFASESLHEYDGHLEVVAQEFTPGTYTLNVEASKGEWKASKALQFVVTPLAVPPNSAGPTILRATGLTDVKAGVPQEITFTAQSLGNTPHSHSEIEMQVLRGGADGAPILINKLHTHGDGKFAATVTFPDAGQYTLLLDPETVHGDPTPRYYYESVGKAPIVTVNVAEGVALPDVPMLQQIAGPLEAEATVTMPIFVVLAALGAGLALRRRQA